MDRGDEVRSFAKEMKKETLSFAVVCYFICIAKEHRVRAQRDHNQWTNFLVAKQYAFPFWLHST